MQKILFAALIGLLSLAGACRDATGSEQDEVGTYQLESINASALPTQFFDVEVVSGSLTLNADHTYSQQTTVRAPDNLGEMTMQTRHVSGTYTREDDSLRVTTSQGEEINATYVSRTITINAGAFAIVYRRQ